MCASTHMNSRGCPGGSYKRGIKTVGQAPRLRTDLRTSSRPVFRCGPQRRHFQASRAALLSGISEGKKNVCYTYIDMWGNVLAGFSCRKILPCPYSETPIMI